MNKKNLKDFEKDIEKFGRGIEREFEKDIEESLEVVRKKILEVREKGQAKPKDPKDSPGNWEEFNSESQEYPKTVLKNSDRPEFIYRRKTIAQVQHICTECERIINPGEEYELVVGKWGEELCSITTCCSCLEIRERFFPDCWSYGKLFEELADALRFDFQKEVEIRTDFLPERARDDIRKLFEKVHGIGPRRPEENKNG